MKTALYIENGLLQAIITPEDDFEKQLLNTFGEKELRAKINVGSFYRCQGGWVRQGEDRSLIISLVVG